MARQGVKNKSGALKRTTERDRGITNRRAGKVKLTRRSSIEVAYGSMSDLVRWLGCFKDDLTESLFSSLRSVKSEGRRPCDSTYILVFFGGGPWGRLAK
jgi:hypothetical protein